MWNALLDIVVSILRNDLEMAFNYRFAGVPLGHVPILALGGKDDPHVEVESILAWERHAASFRSEIYPGGHFYIQHESKDAVRDRIVGIMTSLPADQGSLLASPDVAQTEMRRSSHASATSSLGI